MKSISGGRKSKAGTVIVLIARRRVQRGTGCFQTGSIQLFKCQFVFFFGIRSFFRLWSEQFFSLCCAQIIWTELMRMTQISSLHLLLTTKIVTTCEGKNWFRPSSSPSKHEYIKSELWEGCHDYFYYDEHFASTGVW